MENEKLEKRLVIEGPTFGLERKRLDGYPEKEIEEKKHYSINIRPGNHQYLIFDIKRGSIEESEEHYINKANTERKIISASEDEINHVDIVKSLLDKIETEEGYKLFYRREKQEFLEACYYHARFANSGELSNVFGEPLHILNKKDEYQSGKYLEIEINGGGWIKFNPEEKTFYLNGSSTYSFDPENTNFNSFFGVQKKEAMYEKNTKNNDIGSHTLTKKVLENLLGEEYVIKIND